MRRISPTLFLAATLVLGATTTVQAQYSFVQWPTTGNWYALSQTAGPFSQVQAELATASAALLTQQGVAVTNAYVADVLIASEELFIQNQFGPSTAFWMGLVQDPAATSPAQGWQWTSGAAFSYQNWCTFEPNDYSGPEETRS